MNYKISLAALAVAATVSGQANAALTAAENTALSAFAVGAPGTAWTTALDGTALANNTDWADGVDECTWYGIVCNVGGDITHVEIPNSGLTDIATLLAALTPAAGTLQTLNLSNATAGATHNSLAGSLAGLADFTALTHLAINNASAGGDIPDLSGSTSLNWINVADNAGITGMGAKLAGGSAITLIGVNNNAAMTGDMTATFANIGDPINIQAHGSKVSGTLNYPAGGTVDISVQDAAESKISDIVVVGDAGGASGYDASLVVLPADTVTLNAAGEESATISWTQAAAGAGTGYSVSLTADDGETLEYTAAVAAGVMTASFDNVTAGTYKAVVSATGADDRSSAPVLSASFDVEEAVVVTPPTCEEGETLNETTNECETDEVEEEEEEEAVTSGGGGAALWLAMLPLMALFRRKRA